MCSLGKSPKSLGAKCVHKLFSLKTPMTWGRAKREHIGSDVDIRILWRGLLLAPRCVFNYKLIPYHSYEGKLVGLFLRKTRGVFQSAISVLCHGDRGLPS